MLKHLLPKEHAFFNNFEEHISLVILACEEFIKLAKPGADIVECAKRIETLEHQTDEITHRCIEALHMTFITPIERTDIQVLIKRLDDIIDSIDGSASRILLYEIKEVRGEAAQLAEVLLKATREIEAALKALRSKKNADLIRQKCIRIYDFENRGDEILQSALIRLFKESDPVLIIKWKEIFERLEIAVDRCEDVANTIEGIVISSS
jgi:predicted phosphate transport protein (TIGR00153 family)